MPESKADPEQCEHKRSSRQKAEESGTIRFPQWIRLPRKQQVFGPARFFETIEYRREVVDRCGNRSAVVEFKSRRGAQKLRPVDDPARFHRDSFKGAIIAVEDLKPVEAETDRRKSKRRRVFPEPSDPQFMNHAWFDAK